MNLEERRINAGISVVELAEVAELSREAIYAIQRSGNRPRERAAKLIADRLGCLVTDIWPVTPRTEPEPVEEAA
jgi:DNA-binding XRE family transcriptional regulator